MRSLISAAMLAAFCVCASADAQTVIFSQAGAGTGIGGHFSVTGQYPAYNPSGVFYVHANQPSQQSASGLLNPSTWNPSRFTGLACPVPASSYQLAMSPVGQSGARHSTVQFCPDAAGASAVGIYMTGADMPNPTPGNRFMMAPIFQLPAPVQAFPLPTSVFDVAFDLAVPQCQAGNVAEMSNSYVKLDLHFESSDGFPLSISIGAMNCRGPAFRADTDSGNYDDIAKTAIATEWLGYGTLSTLMSDSVIAQDAPFAPARHFHYQVAAGQFAAGIALAQAYADAHGYSISLPADPSLWTFTGWHLNGEMHCSAGYPLATLGYNLENTVISQY